MAYPSFASGRIAARILDQEEAGFFPSQAVLPHSIITGQVIRVIDGDTVEVAVDNRLIRVRLAYIDTPEVTQYPLWLMATNTLKKLLPLGQIVTLQVLDYLSYGRLVAEVFTRSGSIGHQMVVEGMAAVDPWYVMFAKNDSALQLNQAMQGARQQGIGMWDPAISIERMPWEERKRNLSLGRTAVGRSVTRIG